jgi:hypothetical protein
MTLSININDTESIAAALAQMKQKPEPTVAVVEPTVTQAAVAVTQFERRALPLIERNVPVIPLLPGQKKAVLTSWETKATTNRAQVAQWGQQTPDANVASVAKAEHGGVWFFDADRAGLVNQIEKTTGHKIPDTFMVRSRPGSGHYYFRQNAASIEMGNRQASDQQGELWSARVDDRYVVGPLSIHPDTGKEYEVIKDVPIVEAPQWLIDFCIQNDAKAEKAKTGHAELDSEEPIAQGSRNTTLSSILGKARQVLAMDKEQLLAYGLSVNEKRCRPPLPDAEVKTIVGSIGSYAVKPTGKIEFDSTQAQTTAPGQIELPDIPKIAYPAFPGWIFGGIPAFDKWVKPFCKINSRYAEYMMLPLMVLVMNYMSTKGVRIEYKNFPLSIFLLLVGRKGRVIKSSSAQDAMDFCQKMGILSHVNGATRNAEGKSLVFTVGSTEGLGLEMARVNCKSAVLFYDEFSKLIAKMSIENSSFANDLSTTYESGKFSNGVKSRKETFTHDPGSYCLSLIGCTTDKRYPRLASKLFSSVDGMDERFFVLYQPEVLKDVEPLTWVPIPEEAVKETSNLVDQAVQRQVYSIDDGEPLREISKINNRLEIRAEKWALCFAVLLGKDSVDESCIERGIALAKYEHQIKNYLAVGESITREGGLQREIRLLVERAEGSMKLRDLQRKVNYDDYGTELWYRVYGGLLRSNILVETGTGKHGDPKLVRVVQPMLRDDEN